MGVRVRVSSSAPFKNNRLDANTRLKLDCRLASCGKKVTENLWREKKTPYWYLGVFCMTVSETKKGPDLALFLFLRWVHLVPSTSMVLRMYTSFAPKVLWPEIRSL